MKLICENNNSLHINANGVCSDAADTIGLLNTLLPLCTLDNSDMLNDVVDQTLINYSFKSAEITA